MTNTETALFELKSFSITYIKLSRNNWTTNIQIFIKGLASTMHFEHFNKTEENIK